MHDASCVRGSCADLTAPDESYTCTEHPHCVSVSYIRIGTGVVPRPSIALTFHSLLITGYAVEWFIE